MTPLKYDESLLKTILCMQLNIYFSVTDDLELQNGGVESWNLSDASEMNLDEIISMQQQVSILEISDIIINNFGG